MDWPTYFKMNNEKMDNEKWITKKMDDEKWIMKKVDDEKIWMMKKGR